MSSFKKDEWVLSFIGDAHNAEVRLVRVAENTYEGKEKVQCYFGGYATTAYTAKYLHKLPTSMKKLIPKDKEGKLRTTV